MKQVTVDISPNGGEVVIDVEGVKGAACKNITVKLSGFLGTITGNNDKPELYEEEGITTNVG